MKRILISLLLFCPMIAFGQISKHIIRQWATPSCAYEAEVWEQTTFDCKFYEINNQEIKQELDSILFIHRENDKGWKMFDFCLFDLFIAERGMDHYYLFYLHSYPYCDEHAIGFFTIRGFDVLFFDCIPDFLTPTTVKKTFSYVRHYLSSGEANGKTEKLDLGGEDDIPSWLLNYKDNKFDIINTPFDGHDNYEQLMLINELYMYVLSKNRSRFD